MAKTKEPLKSKAKDKSEKKRLVLLDAHAIIHRAYHALPDFATSKGVPTGALYGLNTMLLKIIEDLKPDYIVAAFDLPEKTHRHIAYDAYKGKRKETDENLATQLESAKSVFIAWGIPIYSVPGFEADDILGTIVELLKKDKNIEIVIASGDMDTMSLIDKKKVQVFTLKKGLNDTILYDEDKVVERFGFGPELLPDYKGLRGDPSDNIIGVKGIGEKTATNLIQAFGTVEKIYKALKKNGDEYKKAGINERVRDLLVENEEEALFSKTLATIRRDAPIDFKLPKVWREALDINILNTLFQELEFRTLPDRVRRLLNSSTSKDSAVLTRQNPTGSDALESSRSLPEDEELKLALWVVDSNLTNPSMEDVATFTKADTLEDAWKVVNAELDKRKSREVFEKIEKPLIPVVQEMNRVGVKIDKQMLTTLSTDYHKELSSLEKQIWEHAGEEFNVNSPKQLG
ncbi:MAG TPA: 5'-3' exonuclease H3TH domain-containing protein, partial [Parcubacteria group bacterium]|nr:5'-3' exonuclease H3TH domain-containing protein [Parcubacteria group bacterium]